MAFGETMENLTINGVNYGDSFENVPPELMAEIANIGPLIPISFGTAEMIVASESVIIEELPFDDIVVHPHK